ncbi:uncharacterized protein [Haliotis cracherodii]|uniref:uncharacterized protein n=1 Tax=Haliotis cracherodii TaxID=6455 RepID=UPI0039E93D49
MFSVRIVTTDHYLAPPIPGLDVTHSQFRGCDVRRVPVLRIFGATPAGQKTCMHVHGVFPYLYVPYDGTQPWERYLRLFATSLDKAINVANNSAKSDVQHVFKISIVSGIPMYGYHAKEEEFLKIYMFNPSSVKKAADLLLGGAVMNKPFQPHEAHIPYNLQLFIDYNLYGMNLINAAAVKFRRDREEDNDPRRNLTEQGPSSLDDSDSTPRTPLLGSGESLDHSGINTPSRRMWDTLHIPSELMLDGDVSRQTTCQLEVDVVAADILNRLEVDANIGANPGLAAIWEDEKQRRRNLGETSQIATPESQDRADVDVAESECILRERLREIIEQQKPFLDSQSDEESDMSQGSQDDFSATPASQVTFHVSQDSDQSESSQSTVILDDVGEEEKQEEGKEEPIISLESIQRVLSFSQSFSQTSQNSDGPDMSLADVLAALADESSPVSSQLSASQVSALEDNDSIISGNTGIVDVEVLKEEEEEMLEMSQRVWDGADQEEALQGENEEHGESEEHNLKGMDDTWTDSQFLPSEMVEEDEEEEDDGGHIPQFDGASDEKSDAPVAQRKRLGVRGQVISHLPMTMQSNQGYQQYRDGVRGNYDNSVYNPPAGYSENRMGQQQPPFSPGGEQYSQLNREYARPWDSSYRIRELDGTSKRNWEHTVWQQQQQQQQQQMISQGHQPYQGYPQHMDDMNLGYSGPAHASERNYSGSYNFNQYQQHYGSQEGFHEQPSFSTRSPTNFMGHPEQVSPNYIPNITSGLSHAQHSSPQLSQHSLSHSTQQSPRLTSSSQHASSTLTGQHTSPLMPPHILPHPMQHTSMAGHTFNPEPTSSNQPVFPTISREATTSFQEMLNSPAPSTQDSSMNRSLSRSSLHSSASLASNSSESELSLTRLSSTNDHRLDDSSFEKLIEKTSSNINALPNMTSVELTSSDCSTSVQRQPSRDNSQDDLFGASPQTLLGGSTPSLSVDESNESANESMIDMTGCDDFMPGGYDSGGDGQCSQNSMLGPELPGIPYLTNLDLPSPVRVDGRQESCPSSLTGLINLVSSVSDTNFTNFRSRSKLSLKRTNSDTRVTNSREGYSWGQDYYYNCNMNKSTGVAPSYYPWGQNGNMIPHHRVVHTSIVQSAPGPKKRGRPPKKKLLVTPERQEVLLPNAAYTYAFHVPTPVFKRLKIRHTSLSHSSEVKIVRMHPMDARRYSLLKIGREVVRIPKLTAKDIEKLSKPPLCPPVSDVFSCEYQGSSADHVPAKVLSTMPTVKPVHPMYSKKPEERVPVLSQFGDIFHKSPAKGKNRDKRRFSAMESFCTQLPEVLPPKSCDDSIKMKLLREKLCQFKPNLEIVQQPSRLENVLEREIHSVKNCDSEAEMNKNGVDREILSVQSRNGKPVDIEVNENVLEQETLSGQNCYRIPSPDEANGHGLEKERLSVETWNRTPSATEAQEDDVEQEMPSGQNQHTSSDMSDYVLKQETLSKQNIDRTSSDNVMSEDVLEQETLSGQNQHTSSDMSKDVLEQETLLEQNNDRISSDSAMSEDVLEQETLSAQKQDRTPSNKIPICELTNKSNRVSFSQDTPVHVEPAKDFEDMDVGVSDKEKGSEKHQKVPKPIVCVEKNNVKEKAVKSVSFVKKAVKDNIPDTVGTKKVSVGLSKTARKVAVIESDKKDQLLNICGTVDRRLAKEGNSRGTDCSSQTIPLPFEVYLETDSTEERLEIKRSTHNSSSDLDSTRHFPVDFSSLEDPLVVQSSVKTVPVDTPDQLRPLHTPPLMLTESDQEDKEHARVAPPGVDKNRKPEALVRRVMPETAAPLPECSAVAKTTIASGFYSDKDHSSEAESIFSIPHSRASSRASSRKESSDSSDGAVGRSKKLKKRKHSDGNDSSSSGYRSKRPSVNYSPQAFKHMFDEGDDNRKTRKAQRRHKHDDAFKNMILGVHYIVVGRFRGSRSMQVKLKRPRLEGPSINVHDYFAFHLDEKRLFDRAVHRNLIRPSSAESTSTISEYLMESRIINCKSSESELSDVPAEFQSSRASTPAFVLDERTGKFRSNQRKPDSDNCTEICLADYPSVSRPLETWLEESTSLNNEESSTPVVCPKQSASKQKGSGKETVQDCIDKTADVDALSTSTVLPPEVGVAHPSLDKHTHKDQHSFPNKQDTTTSKMNTAITETYPDKYYPVNDIHTEHTVYHVQHQGFPTEAVYPAPKPSYLDSSAVESYRKNQISARYLPGYSPGQPYNYSLPRQAVHDSSSSDSCGEALFRPNLQVTIKPHHKKQKAKSPYRSSKLTYVQDKKGKRKSLTPNQRLGVAFLSTRHRRKKSNGGSCKLMNSLSVLHQATLANLTDTISYADGTDDYKTKYEDVMYKLALVSPPQSDKGETSPPIPLSPEDGDKDMLLKVHDKPKSTSDNTSQTEKHTPTGNCVPSTSAIASTSGASAHVSMDSIYETPLSSVENNKETRSPEASVLVGTESDSLPDLVETKTPVEGETKASNVVDTKASDLENDQQPDQVDAKIADFIETRTASSSDVASSESEVTSKQATCSHNLKTAVVLLKPLSLSEINKLTRDLKQKKVSCSSPPNLGSPICSARYRRPSGSSSDASIVHDSGRTPPPCLTPHRSPRVSDCTLSDCMADSQHSWRSDKSRDASVPDKLSGQNSISSDKLSFKSVNKSKCESSVSFRPYSSVTNSPANSQACSNELASLSHDSSSNQSRNSDTNNSTDSKKENWSVSSSSKAKGADKGASNPKYSELKLSVRNLLTPRENAINASTLPEHYDMDCPVVIKTSQYEDISSDEDDEPTDATRKRPRKQACHSDPPEDKPKKNKNGGRGGYSARDSTGHSQGSSGGSSGGSLPSPEVYFGSVVLRPQTYPPTRDLVSVSAHMYGLYSHTAQNAYCSNPDDLPDKPRELGGTVLKLQSNRVRDLEEFETSAGTEGLKNWRSVFAADNNLFSSQTIEPLWEKLDKDPEFKFMLSEDRHIAITPCNLPPRGKDVKHWFETKAARIKTDAKTETVTDTGIEDGGRPEDKGMEEYVHFSELAAEITVEESRTDDESTLVGTRNVSSVSDSDPSGGAECVVAGADTGDGGGVSGADTGDGGVDGTDTGDIGVTGCTRDTGTCVEDIVSGKDAAQISYVSDSEAGEDDPACVSRPQSGMSAYDADTEVDLNVPDEDLAAHEDLGHPRRGKYTNIYDMNVEEDEESKEYVHVVVETDFSFGKNSDKCDQDMDASPEGGESRRQDAEEGVTDTRSVEEPCSVGDRDLNRSENDSSPPVQIVHLKKTVSDGDVVKTDSCVKELVSPLTHKRSDKLKSRWDQKESNPTPSKPPSTDPGESSLPPVHSTPVRRTSIDWSDPLCTPISTNRDKAVAGSSHDSSPFVTPRKPGPIRRLSSNTETSLRRSILASQLKSQLATPTPKRSTSQIDGPTPKNAYGFKLTQQNYQDAKALHEHQYLTVMSMEVHVETRGDLRPDPEVDTMQAIFYSIFNDVPPAKGERHITGAIVVDVASARAAHMPNSPRPKPRPVSPQPSTSRARPEQRPVSPKPSTSRARPEPKLGISRSSDEADASLARTRRQTASILKKSGVEDINTEYVTNETELVESFVKLIHKYDPDIVVGYEIQMLSWGFVLQRATHLGTDLCTRISRTPDSKEGNRAKAGGNDWGSDYTSEINITGRIVLNLWRLLRHEVTLNIYSFENTAFHILHRRVPLYTTRTLSLWFNHRAHHYRWRVVEHYVTKVKGVLQIMDQLDLVGKTSEFARVFGIEFYHVLSRGSQYRVESMMLRLAKPMNFLPASPSVEQRARQKAPECIPLTLEPESRFYPNPVVVLDFQSLYPSIMIAYNYCFSTCLGRVQRLAKAHEGPFEFGCSSLKIPPAQLKKLEKDVTISPNGVVFLKDHVRQGVLPRMVGEILKTRLMVKKAMKGYKHDKTLSRLLNARQLGLKLIANVTYGYTGASFSGRMPCIEVADSIVRKARETLERSIRLVEDTPQWRAKVVYGDTDSMFIHLEGRSKDEAFKIGQEIADAVTAMFPKPIKLKFEKVYMPCVLQTKKRYVGFSYETVDQKEPVYDAKGIETVRRDNCAAVGKILERCIKLLFTTRDVSQVKAFVQRQCQKLMEGKVSIQDCIFAKEFRGMMGYKPSACVPGLEIAKKLMRQDRRAEPRVGERIPYVIVYGSPGLPLIQLVRHPSEVLRDPTLRINGTYYITKAILPPLHRLFSLIGVDVFAWYQGMPKVIRVVPQAIVSGDSKKGTISQYFSVSNCPVCDEQTKQPICATCMRNPQMVAVTLMDKIRRWESVHDRLAEVCYTCMGAQDSTQPCTSLECPILFRRALARNDVSRGDHLRQCLEKVLPF